MDDKNDEIRCYIVCVDNDQKFYIRMKKTMTRTKLAQGSAAQPVRPGGG